MSNVHSQIKDTTRILAKGSRSSEIQPDAADPGMTPRASSEYSQFRSTIRTLAKGNRSSGIVSNNWQENDSYRNKHKVRLKILKVPTEGRSNDQTQSEIQKSKNSGE